MSADYRQDRLLSNNAWPLKLSIGKPSALQLKNQLASVKEHINEWHKLKVGVVEWSEIKYQSATTAIKTPVYWYLNQPTDWIEATTDQSIKNRFNLLIEVIKSSEPVFHGYLVRHRSLWRVLTKKLNKGSFNA
ncbi:MAG: hypothetical protein ACJAS9_000905 [Polaribacter sp.]